MLDLSKAEEEKCSLVYRLLKTGDIILPKEFYIISFYASGKNNPSTSPSGRMIQLSKGGPPALFLGKGIFLVMNYFCTIDHFKGTCDSFNEIIDFKKGLKEGIVILNRHGLLE